MNRFNTTSPSTICIFENFWKLIWCGHHAYQVWNSIPLSSLRQRNIFSALYTFCILGWRHIDTRNHNDDVMDINALVLEYTKALISCYMSLLFLSFFANFYPRQQFLMALHFMGRTYLIMRIVSLLICV